MLAQVSLLLVAASAGIMVFFGAVVAPVLFTVLPPDWSAAVVRRFFPRYFVFLGVITAVAAALAPGLVAQATLGACALLFGFNRFWLIARINAARDAGQQQRFDRLHRLSVGLNLVQLLALVGVLVLGLR